MKPTCSILVLSYNRQDLLSQFLESVIIAADHARICDTNVTLIDNQSTDGSKTWVETHLPQVKVLLAPANRYLYSLNWAAEQIDSELMVLLNNDIEMTPDCLDPLFDILLSDSQAFSVTPQLLGMDQAIPNGGRYLGSFHRGLLCISLTNNVTEVAPTLFGCGGAMLVRKDRFLALRGFDELYYPAYWEDVDLCYRAWKQGLSSLYQPQSVMYHVNSASMNAAPSFQKSVVSYRNCWLLTWRNVSDIHILASNLYWTARYYTYALRKRDKGVLAVHHEAFARWQKAISTRRWDGRCRRLSDAEIVRQVCNTIIE